MGYKMKLFPPLIALLCSLLVGCASIPKSEEWNWARVWNRAITPLDRERAVRIMPQHDYIRYSEQVVRNYVNPNMGSIPVYDAEREMIYFRMAALYLWDWQAQGGLNADKARVYARKLLELPNLHPMSKFLIARVQELEGGDYNLHYVPVPKGMGMWWFMVGQGSNTPTELNFGNLKGEYARILSAKQGGVLGKGTQIGCAAFILCLGSVTADDESVITDLRWNVYLDVTDKQGKPVQIGVSSWTELAKSQ